MNCQKTIKEWKWVNSLCVLLFMFNIIYYVYLIISLVNTTIKKQSELCNASNLWLYGFVLLFGSFLIMLNVKNNNDKTLSMTLQFLYILCMSIWGSYEFFFVSCANKLNHTILYKTIFPIYIVIITICIIIIIHIGIKSCNSVVIIPIQKVDNQQFEKNKKKFNNIIILSQINETYDLDNLKSKLEIIEKTYNLDFAQNQN